MIRTHDLLQALVADIQNKTGYTNIRIGAPLGKSTVEPTIYVYPMSRNIQVQLSHYKETFGVYITVERTIAVPEDDINVWNVMDDITQMFTDTMYVLNVGNEGGIIRTITWDYRSFTQSNSLLRWGIVSVIIEFSEH